MKHRRGHRCQYTYIVVGIVLWEGLAEDKANEAYDVISHKVGNYGIQTVGRDVSETVLLMRQAKMLTILFFCIKPRGCHTNAANDCLCQGLPDDDNADFSGASFTYGCSRSGYFNLCKFAVSTPFRHGEKARKFRLTESAEEPELELLMDRLVDGLTGLHRVVAPKAYNNMKALHEFTDCRIGTGQERTFSGKKEER